MKMSPLTLAAATLCLGLLVAPARVHAGFAGEYRIAESSQPGGGSPYRGKIAISSAAGSGAAHEVRWTLESGQSYRGPGILVNNTLGVGYGEGLTGLAVYEIKGRTLKAKWLLPATPQTVGDYELSGPAGLSGFYKFTNGTPGGVTLKPNGNGNVFDVRFALPTGSFDGIAIRVGNVLVAVSGKPGSDYGVAAYRAVSGTDRLVGVWAVPGQTNLGTESLVPTASPSAPTPTAAAGPSGGGGAVGFRASGTEVRFAGDTYQLKENQSSPGSVNSELREYLRPGETFEQYPKMVALRVQEASGRDPLAFTRSILQSVKKSYPTAVTTEIAHTDDSATIEFLLVNGNDVEYNFWHYFRVPQGRLASVQFVLRNKAPYETKEKFKAQRTAHFDDWVRDAKTLALQVPAALAQTAKVAAAGKPPPPEQKPASDDALAKKLGADLQTAGGIAGNFLNLLKAGKLPEAAALVADEGFTQMRTTKGEFLARLRQSQQADGRVLSFAPDKGKTDFGAETGGGVYFVLVADSRCEKTASARETLRFLRFPDGKIKLVGYQRGPGGAR